MTLFDYVVLAIVVVSVIVSVVRGLVREVLSLTAWLVAFFVAGRWAQELAPLLPAGITGPTVRYIVAFTALLFGTLVLGAVVNWIVARLIRVAGLQFADRGLGGLFGLARGILIVMTIVMVAGMTSLPQQPVWRDALFSPLAEEAVRTAKPLLPEAWARYVHY